MAKLEEQPTGWRVAVKQLPVQVFRLENQHHIAAKCKCWLSLVLHLLPPVTPGTSAGAIRSPITTLDEWQWSYFHIFTTFNYDFGVSSLGNRIFGVLWCWSRCKIQQVFRNSRRSACFERHSFVCTFTWGWFSSATPACSSSSSSLTSCFSVSPQRSERKMRSRIGGERRTSDVPITALFIWALRGGGGGAVIERYTFLDRWEETISVGLPRGKKAGGALQFTGTSFTVHVFKQPSEFIVFLWTRSHQRDLNLLQVKN